MNLTSWCVTASITRMEWTVKSACLSLMTGHGGGQLPKVPASACPVTAVAGHKNAILTLSSTVPRAMAATVPTAEITQMVPTVRGAGRTSSAWATTKPAPRATAVLLVLSAHSVIVTADAAVSQE